MAKKIVISFSAQPVAGTGVNYTIMLDGLDLVYPNGNTSVSFEYTALSIFTDKVYIDPILGLSGTINNTLYWLVNNYAYPGITYTRVNDTIEVLIDIQELAITVTLGALNASITATVYDVSTPNTIALIYFFQYKNVVDHEYLCEIYKKGYVGDVTEIHGTVKIEKGQVQSLLEPIRGGGLSLSLEASKDLTLEDLYSENEQDFTVKLYKNGTLVFRGYVHPDGVYQDYVRDEWKITLDCVDGLGSLANLSFVQTNGVPFQGKHKGMDIVYNCLKRTGMSMPINVSINTVYDDDSSFFVNGILNSIYFDTNRFLKKDNDTIMSCEEVLKSVLDVFKACITQVDAEWYIYKPNEIHYDPYVVFAKFDINNTFTGYKTVNLTRELGSQIDGFYPHHCTGNQKIEIKGGIGGFRLCYKYGLVSGLLPNPKLIKDGNLLLYDGWTVGDSFNMLNDPTKDHGFYYKNAVTLAATSVKIISDPLVVSTDDDLSLKIDFEVVSPFGSSFVKFKIQQGTHYLKYTPKNSETPIEDTKNAVWTTTSTDVFIIYLTGKIGSFTIQLPKIQSDGNLTVAILALSNDGTNSTTWIKSLDIVPTQNASALEGEFHTVERVGRTSTIVKENQTVFNGDNPSIVYQGAIFKNDGLTPTDLWIRKSQPAFKFPLLRIAAEEELRIAQKPTKVFTGDFYGGLSYLSVISINNIGKFMPIEWSYDTYNNVTTCKSLELFANEIDDTQYRLTYDYGETVKPTIV